VPLADSGKVSAPRTGGWALFERAARKLATLTGLDRFAPPHPSEFGLYVVMRKR
jgi:hypothetical protein